MCGRFSLTSSYEDLQQQFELLQSFFMKPRYNIAPSQKVMVQIKPQTIDFFEWGLKIDWLTQKLENKRFINARAETILEKPLFRQAIRKQRCLVLADGFYEWKVMGRQKQPYYIFQQNKKPFAMAGIYENETVALITTAANALISEVHSRMPVIISSENYHNWLNPNLDAEKISELLKPSLSQLWSIYPVSTAVNKPDFDNMLCLRSLH